MQNGSTHPADQRPIIRDLVAEIEAIRTKRKQQWRDEPHPEGKRWTQAELRDLVCPSYHHLLTGGTQTLPSRALVLHIATFLECTIHETNDLLLAAQYLPQQSELRADAYAAALQRARTMLPTMPLPAIIVGQGWQMLAADHTFLLLHGLSALGPINGLAFAFDPLLPARQRLSGTADRWRTNAAGYVTAFRRSNLVFAREAWYRTITAHARQFPDFDACWEHNDAPDAWDKGGVERSTFHLSLPAGDQPVRFHFTEVRMAEALYPFIGLLVPIDASTRHAFSTLDTSLAENRWEHALALGASPLPVVE